MTEKHKHNFEIYIKTPPEKLWQALTDGSATKEYYFGTEVRSDWKKGSPMQYIRPDGELMIDGSIIEIEPKRRLVSSFIPLWSPDLKEKQNISQTTFEIEQAGDSCKLRLIHDEIIPEGDIVDEVFEGWSQILSGLKTLLDTGEPLTISRPA